MGSPASRTQARRRAQLTPDRSFLKALVWLQLAEARDPVLSDLGFGPTVIIDRRRQRQRPRHLDGDDLAHPWRQRALGKMPVQRREAGLAARGHGRKTREAVAFAHEWVDNSHL